MRALGRAAGKLPAELVVQGSCAKSRDGGAFPELEQQVEQPLGSIFLNIMHYFFLYIFNLMSIRGKFTWLDHLDRVCIFIWPKAVCLPAMQRIPF